MFKPGKSSKSKFTFHKKATDTPVDKLSHVSYAVKSDGSVSTSTSVLQKRKKGIEGDVQCETTGSDIPDIEGSSSFGAEEAPAIDVTLEGPIDQAYLEHVGETVLDEKEKAARTRPKGVCQILVNKID
ncbi:hypothetical protein CVT26_005806 [Gymnopilus dilepis]|uniref:Uncharacterized protein n=1 Tax=Gymnopilus dilepis TaxID=231916 RepID=A0A409X9X0_9AGAR|nr:hypothetical protein CVT26_005806 [Gymnopilus dilepis]